jgi:alkanesulfonate monooxygenase SsuD/methylene tetrahydromethanopterin reductase-like flavin-dependent oxidoreductase (luciferase family)
VKAAAKAAGRDPQQLTGAMYLTLAIDDDASRAEARIDAYLEQYYGQRPDVMRKRQMCYAGPAAGASNWLKSYADAGASHLVLRFAGEHEKQLEIVARMRRDLGW